MHKSSLKDSLVKTIHDAEETFEEVLYEKWHIRLHRRAKHHVHRLRKKPDHHKEAIAFGVAFVVTAVVFTGWYFFSLPRIIDSFKLNSRENAALNASANPFDNVGERLQVEPEVTNIESF